MKKEKKLFAVVDSETKSIVQYFSCKSEAKALRNIMNPTRKEDFKLGTKERFYIGKGPDHRLYNNPKPSARS